MTTRAVHEAKCIVVVIQRAAKDVGGCHSQYRIGYIFAVVSTYLPGGGVFVWITRSAGSLWVGGESSTGFDFGCEWIEKVLHSSFTLHPSIHISSHIYKEAKSLMGHKKNTRPQIISFLSFIAPLLLRLLFIAHISPHTLRLSSIIVHTHIPSCCVTLARSFFGHSGSFL